MNRRQFLKLASAAGLTFLGANRAHAVGLAPSSLELVRVHLDRPNLPAAFHGFKIAFMADVHFGSTGVTSGLVEQAFEMAMAETPDVICFGGDLITGWSSSSSLPEFLSICRSIRAPQGVYAVMGNHEFGWGETEAMRAFERSGIRMLRNETVFLTRGSDRLPLIGIDNMFNQTWTAVQKNVEVIGVDPNAVVLEHTPDFAPVLPPNFAGTLLSGHTHGGQIILPVLRQTMTASRFGLRYVSGLYPVGRGVMYVTRGVGAVLVPMRIGCPPEVTLLEFSSSRQTAA